MSMGYCQMEQSLQVPKKCFLSQLSPPKRIIRFSIHYKKIIV